MIKLITCKTCINCNIKGNGDSDIGVCTITDKLMSINVKKECTTYLRNDEEAKIEEAIRLLRNKGYSIIKLTEDMKKDVQECAYYSEIKDGQDKDCISCKCNMCIAEFM